MISCCCYHKGTYFQANHNKSLIEANLGIVVVATTKVRIFKQITTISSDTLKQASCCCYHKGTYFQANHNKTLRQYEDRKVVVATTKVRIFKQITTVSSGGIMKTLLLLLPQRYVFSSKSQQRVL